MSVRPISPDEARLAKNRTIPDAVIEAFNSTIVKHLDSRGNASFQQVEVLDLLKEQDFKPDQIFENHWFDIEPFYDVIGWIVEYDKPAYNESYEPTFTFTRKVR